MNQLPFFSFLLIAQKLSTADQLEILLKCYTPLELANIYYYLSPLLLMSQFEVDPISVKWFFQLTTSNDYAYKQ